MPWQLCEPTAPETGASLYLDGGEAQALNFRTVSPEGDRIHTFVSQYTAGIVGQQNFEHAWLEWFFRLHADLLAGSTGRWLDGWFALVQAVLSLSGIVLWWRGLRQWRRGFAYERRASWKRQVWDAHNLLGFAGSLFILLLSITGAYFSFPSTYRLVAARVTGTPAELPVLTVSAIAPDQWASLESLRAAAQQSIPDGEVTMINFPAKPDAPFSVRLKRSGDYHRIGYNYVVLESSTAVVLRIERFDQQPLGVQLMRLMTPLHYGTFGGTFTRILYVFVGFLPAILFGSGILMYWNRVLAKRWGSGANRHVSRTGVRDPRLATETDAERQPETVSTAGETVNN